MSNTAFRGLILERKGLTWSSNETSSTPALRAAEYMSSSKMSQPVKTRSLSLASGTKFVDLGRAALGAFAEANGAHLGERADGAGNSFAHRFDARNKRGGDCAHTRDHDPQFAFGGRELAFVCIGISCFLLVGMLSVRFMKECTNPLSSRTAASIAIEGA